MSHFNGQCTSDCRRDGCPDDKTQECETCEIQVEKGQDGFYACGPCRYKRGMEIK